MFAGWPLGTISKGNYSFALLGLRMYFRSRPSWMSMSELTDFSFPRGVLRFVLGVGKGRQLPLGRAYRPAWDGAHQGRSPWGPACSFPIWSILSPWHKVLAVCRGNSHGVRLLPSGAAMNRTPNLWLQHIPALSCQPLRRKVQRIRRHSSFPGGGEEADGARESQVRQTERGRQRNKAAGRSRQCLCLLIFGQ